MEEKYQYIDFDVTTRRGWKLYVSRYLHIRGWHYDSLEHETYVYSCPSLRARLRKESKTRQDDVVFARSDSPYATSSGSLYGNLLHIKCSSILTLEGAGQPGSKRIALDTDLAMSFQNPDGQYYYRYIKRLDDNHIISASVSPYWVIAFADDYWSLHRDYVLYELSDEGYTIYTRYWDGGASYASRERPFAWDNKRDVGDLTVEDWLALSTGKPRFYKYKKSGKLVRSRVSSTVVHELVNLTHTMARNIPDQELGYEAYRSFRIVDAPLLRELIDTATDLSGGPSEFLSSPREFVESLKGLNGKALVNQIKILSKDPNIRTLSGEKYLNHVLSQPIDVLKSIAGLNLFTTFGVKLPVQTLKDWLSDSVYRDILESYGVVGTSDLALLDPDSELALDAGTALPILPASTRSKAKRKLERLFGDSALRASMSREVAGIQCRFSMNLGYTTWDDWRDYVNAFYKAGLLLSVSDGWDLMPLSFVIDWCSGVVKNLTEFLDYTANLYRLKMTYVERSVKFHTDIPLVSDDGSKWHTTAECYFRWYNNIQPPRVHHTDLYEGIGKFNGSFSWHSSSTAASLAISMLL